MLFAAKLQNTEIKFSLNMTARPFLFRFYIECIPYSTGLRDSFKWEIKAKNMILELHQF